MRWLLPVILFCVALCTVGCGSLSYTGLVDLAYSPFSEELVSTDDGRMGIDMIGEPTVQKDGTVRIFARFKKPDNAAGKVSLQDVDMDKGWVALEGHDLPMLIPDFQWRSTNDPSVPHVRRLRVRPGDLSGVEWAPIKRVTMVSGWPEDGSVNRLWFKAFKQGGEVTLDESDKDREWGWEWVPAIDTEPAKVRIWAGGTTAEPMFERWYPATD